MSIQGFNPANIHKRHCPSTLGEQPAPKQPRVDDPTEVSVLSWANEKLDEYRDIAGKVIFKTYIQGLSWLSLSGLPLSSLPSCIGDLTKLEALYLNNCEGLEELPASFTNLQAITELYLSGTHISSFPKNFGNLTKLRVVDLSRCPLRSLPQSILNLPAETKISLDWYELSPQEFKKLSHTIHAENYSGPNLDSHMKEVDFNFIRNITSWAREKSGEGRQIARKQILNAYRDGSSYLNLNRLEISSLPSCIGDLTNLEELYLNNCIELDELPESFGNLQALKKLSLSGSGICSLPENFEDLTNLEALYLNDCPNIHRFPENLTNLQALKKLDLSGNFINSLPSCIGDLTNLEVLDLSRTFLHKLPESFGNLQALKTLDLSGSRIELLPENFGNLAKLRALNLSGCPLESLHQSILNVSVETQILLACYQFSILEDKKNSKTLYKEGDFNFSHHISFCENKGNISFIHQINSWIKEKPAETDRGRAGNQILNAYVEGSSYLNLDKLEISSLPSCIGDLTNLEVLSLHECTSLEALPESFGNLQALEHLVLADTLISSLPESFGNLTNLEELYLNCSSIEELPESFGNLQALYYLELESTHISSFPESFGNLTNLELLLSLDCESFEALPASFGNLTKLRQVELSGCPLRSLPESILNLPKTTSISFSASQIPQAVLNRIREATNAEDYSGPRLSFDMRNSSLNETAPSLDKILTDYFKIAEMQLEESPESFLGFIENLEETDKQCLATWLHRLCSSTDMSRSGEFDQQFAQKIISYLTRADKDENFRSALIGCVAEAIETCGDRMILSVLRIGIEFQLATIDLNDPKKVAGF